MQAGDKHPPLSALQNGGPMLLFMLGIICGSALTAGAAIYSMHRAGL